jgi:hypothetical protein
MAFPWDLSMFWNIRSTTNYMSFPERWSSYDSNLMAMEPSAVLHSMNMVDACNSHIKRISGEATTVPKEIPTFKFVRSISKPMPEMKHTWRTEDSMLMHIVDLTAVRVEKEAKDDARGFLPEPVIEAMSERSQAAATVSIENKVLGRVVAPTKEDKTRGTKACGFKEAQMTAAAARRASASAAHVARIRAARAQ